jgi:hypothetical protein
VEQLEQQLRDALAAEATAISVRSDVLVVVDSFDHDTFAPPSDRKIRPVWAAIAAAVAVLLLIGVVPTLLGSIRGGELVTDSAPDPTIPATTAPPVSATQAPPVTSTTLATTTVPVVVPPPGTSWERVVDAALQEGEIWAVANTDDVIVAAGDVYDPTEVSTLQGESTNAVVWVSTDGRSWERIDNEAVFGGPGSQILWEVVTGPGGIIATGQDGADAALWFSPDGYQWEKVLVDDLGTPGAVDELSVISGEPGWVAIENDDDPGDAVFVSSDGIEWSRIENPTAIQDYVARSESSVRQAVTEPSTLGVHWKYAWDGELVMAVGRNPAVATWISTDAGVNWHRLFDAEDPAFEGYPWPQTLDVTFYGSAIIVGGNSGGDAAIWIGTWDEN